MANTRILTCDLTPFAGKDPNSTSINKQEIEYSLTIPSFVTIEAAWSVTLHLYSGLNPVSFESRVDGSAATRVCEIQPHDSLATIVTSLQRDRVNDEDRYHYNTGVIFQKTINNEGQFHLSETLQPGLDVVLHVAGSGVQILARHTFMALDEVKNLGKTFSHVLTSFANNPDQTIRHVGISGNDIAQIVSWNSGILTRTECLIHDEFSRVSHLYPHKPAIESWDGDMSYQELHMASDSLAGKLMQSAFNVGPGSWVPFCFNKSRWAIISMLAIIKAGAACVPLDPRHPPTRVQQIVGTTGAKLILVGEAETGNRLSSDFPSLQVINVTKMDLLQNEEHLASSSKTSLRSESPAIGLFTSGSTGTPKGIIATHATICTGASSYACHVGADDNTRVLQFASYTFDVCMVDVFTALLHGGTLCIPSEEERMDGLEEYIARTRPNWAALTPTVARILDPAMCSSFLQKLLLVGEMVRESDIEGWVNSGVSVYNVYGPAENNLITTAAQVVKGRASSVGRGVNTRTWIADFESERLMPIGAVGELICEGPQLTPAYLNDPERTRSSFFDDLEWIPCPSIGGNHEQSFSRRFYRSGDLVRYCADGSLQCVGRLDSQVKLGGQRVELSDIESHIQSHNAAVLVPRAGPLQDKLIAVLEGVSSTPQTRPTCSSSPFSRCDLVAVKEVIKTLRASLPSYMCPSVWISIGNLPSSASGKLDRKALITKFETLSQEEYLELVLDGDMEGEKESTHANIRQQLLREVCSQVLNIPVGKIAMARSFAGHGGDSITAMQASSLIKRTQNLVVGVKDILTCPTLAEAASRIRDATNSLQLPVTRPGKLYSLSPIQRLFMVTAPTSATWNHYNQSVLMRLRERREVEDVKEALYSLVRRHAMLRARFARSSSGEWMQRILPEDECHLSFEYFPDVVGFKQKESLMLRARESLDIERGPLLRAQLFEGQGQHGMLLFIVSHHLIVDLVSWRVMLEEVEASLVSPYKHNSLLREAPTSIPFLAWSELQHEMAKGMRPDHTIPPRSNVPPPDFSYWGISPVRNVYRDVTEKRISLGDITTRNVLYKCHEALHTEPVDIFLAAILLSFKRAFPERPTPPVFNEGHGREPWNSELDVSRTVGWFTTMFPIYVSDISAGDVVDTVRRVKDFRKGTADNGFQYFSTKYLHQEGRRLFRDHIPAEIMFNYEGRYQSLEKDESLLMTEDWKAGEALSDSSPDLQRFCLFELSAAVLVDGELHFTMAWNSRARYQERISLWLTRLLPAVIDEIVTYLMLEKRQFTLSDLDLAGLSDYSDLDALVSSLHTIPGVDGTEGLEDVYCGSPMQDALALSQSTSKDGAYEIDITWKVTDSRDGSPRIDLNRLSEAWNDVVARHAVLRTVFLEATTSTKTSMIHQVVLKKYQPSVVLMDADTSVDALDRLASCVSYKEKGLLVDKRPPHLLAICSTAQGHTFVRLQVNHILFDGTSISPLLRDLSKAYQNSQGLQTEWTWKPFADFIRYIRDEDRREEDIAYWKTYLATARPCHFPALTDEGTKHDGKANQQRGSVQVPLTRDAAQLGQFLAEMEVTMPTLIQLTWAMVLRMYTADTQIVFGYLASGRDAPVDNIQDAVGPFISILIHFLDFDDEENMSVADVLRRIQDRSARSISHQSCSLAEIQGALGIGGNSLLFNSGISFMSKWTREMQLRDRSALLFEQIAAHDPTEFDVSLIVETGDDGVNGMSVFIDYRTATIGRQHATNIAASFDYLLSEITQDPSLPLSQIGGISTHDTEQIWDWNKVLTVPLEKCLHDIFIEKALESPSAEAISSWDGSMSYGQLHQLSSRLAKHLAQLGVGPETKVPLCFEKSIWTIVATIGVLKAGGCFVLLDPSHPESRIWSIIDEIEASVLICSPLTNKSKKLDALTERGDRHVTVLELKPSFINNLPLVKDEASICASVSPDNAAYVVFTSGTTGTPKGVVVTHQAIVTGLIELSRAAGMVDMGSETRTLQFASYAFDASIGDIFCTLQNGGCVCVMCDDNRSPADITDFIQRNRVTYAGITPSFASLLDPSSVPSLRVLCFSGEALSASQIEVWSGRVKIINMYGPTEATVACIAKPEVEKTTAASNIGRAFRGTTWVVDENNHDQLRAVGAPGELLIEGPILAREYFKRPEQTAQAFIESPSWLKDKRPTSRLYKTGDMVRYNTDGTISYIGRKDNQIKINGQRVEVSEIEHTLRATAGSAAGPIIVELLKRKDLGEADVLAAFIYVGGHDLALESDQAINNKKSSIIAQNPQLLELFDTITSKLTFSGSSLPRYMWPQAFIPIERLPLTTSGKVDRRALQHASSGLGRSELFSFVASLDTNPHEQNTGIEADGDTLLAQLWENVLGVKANGGQSNFFRLGGNSMAAMGLRAEAIQAGFQLSVADILANPTLRDMAKAMIPSPSTSLRLASSTSSHSLPKSLPTTPDEHNMAVLPFSLLPGIELSWDQELSQEICDSTGIRPSEIEDVFPCTPMQEGLMVSSAHREGHGAYTLHAPFKLPTDLDRERFKMSWESTTMIHSILRSRIVPNSQGSLIVVQSSPVHVRESTASTLDKHIEQQRSKDFGYGQPLLRMAIVFDQSTQCHYFVISIHHTLFDGWSFSLMWDTAIELYQGTQLVQPRPSFQSFVQQLKSAPLSSSKEYWKSHLVEQDREGFQFPTVPAAHKPIATASATFRFSFQSKVAVSAGVTPSVLINAAWAILLSQYTTSSTVNFGVTLSGRDFPMPYLDQVVGPTIVTMPRQFHVAPNQTVLEFLEYVQQVTAASIPHQHLGMQEIRALDWSAQQACNFSTLILVNHDMVDLRSSLSPLGITPVEVDSVDFHPYPFAVEFSLGPESVSVNVGYDPICIGASMVSHVMQQFKHILQNLCQSCHDPSEGSFPVNLAAIMTEIAPTQLHNMLSWNEDGHRYGESQQFQSILDLIDAKVRVNPLEIAVRAEDGVLSYAELDQLANIVSHGISKGGSHPGGEFVGICFDKSAAAIVSMLAVLKSGSAFMPLGPSQPSARLESLLIGAEVQIVLTSPAHIKLLSTLPSHRRIVSVDLHDVAQRQQTQPYNSNHALEETRAAYLLYTSGTTGQPKGVVVEHGAWSRAIASQIDFFGFTRHTRMLQFSNYTFDASIFEIFITLCSGGLLCIPSEHSRVNDLEGYISHNELNTITLTPTVARVLHPEKLPHVKQCLFGGESLTQSDVKAWVQQGRRVTNCYGPTEACVFACGRDIEVEAIDTKSTNIGRPVGINAWVISPMTGSICPIGAPGELCLEGHTLARGYHNDPEKTRLSFSTSLLDSIPGKNHGKRVYRTGDIVRYETDGTLDFLGRRDGQVKVRGHRIDVGEIEHHIQHAMADDPSFHSSTVQLYWRDRKGYGEPEITALLRMDMLHDETVHEVPCTLLSMTSKIPTSAKASQLRYRLRRLLPEYMVPSIFIAVARFPTTASGKLDKDFAQSCIEHLLAQGKPEVEQDETWSVAETRVREWWSTILGVDVSLISRHGNFFVLGGNSIHAIRLVGLARSKSYRLQYEDIFSSPALVDMVSRLLPIGHDDENKPELLSSPEPFELISEPDLKSVFDTVLPSHNISKNEVEDVYPCTALQESLMVETARHRGAYMLVETVDVPASQVTHFQDAWFAVFNVYEILRTTIVLSHGQKHGAWQVVMKSHPLRWTEFPDVDSFIEFAYDSHDYGKPLIQLGILDDSDKADKEGKQNVVRCGFCIHHAAYDGWSLSNIWQRIYQELSDSPPSSSFNHVTPYKSFIRNLIQQTSEQAIAHWGERFAGLSNTRLIPRSSHTEHRPLATDSTQRAVQLSRLHDQSHLQGKTATIAQAAWAMTICHYTANNDTVFGTILSGRESAAGSISGIEAIAGPTIVTVPSRTVIDYGSSVSDLVAVVQRNNLSAIRFSHIGLEQISRIDQDCRQACQFDSIFVVQPPLDKTMGTTSTGVVRQTVDTRGFFSSPMIVEVQLSEDGEEVTVTMSFDPIIVSWDLQNHQAELMLDTYITILGNLVHLPEETPLQRISALSLDHITQIGTVNGSSTKSVRACVHDLVRKQVELSPFLTAIDSWDGSMTYAELDDLSTSLAQKLSYLGIKPQKAVCMLFEKSKWAIVAMLGVAKAGGCFVPLNPQNPVKRLQHLVQTVDALVILTSPQHQELSTSLSLCKVMVIGPNSLPLPTATFLKPPHTSHLPVEAQHTAYILFTSGSTGLPKGVVIEHQALCSSLVALTDRIGMGTHSRTLQFNSYWFDGMLLEIFGTLIVGGTICGLSESERMNDLAGSIERIHANTITTLATSVSRLIEPSSVPSLETVCLGGEPVLPSDRDRWASKVKLLSVYGPTETCIIMLVGDMKCNSPATLLGQPVGSRVWVVNHLKDNELAPLGGIGELFIEGPGLARHYLNDEDKSAATFVSGQPWMVQEPHLQEPRRVYKTGDLVRMSPDGTVTWIGRKDSSQVKIRGQRVELAEIEEVIRQHIPKAIPVAVDIFTPSNNDEMQILGAVLATSSVVPGGSSDQVAAFMQKLTVDLMPKLKGTLPHHMVPSVFIPLSDLPFLSTGKLDRKTLHNLAIPLAVEMSKGTATTSGQAPRTPKEKLLSDLWTEVLGSQEKPAGRTDNFFNVGGDSMMAMRLVALARYRGLALTVVDIFNYPILSNMADMVQALDHDEDSLKEEPHDARTVDEKAYNLSTLQHLSQQAMPICADKIEQIYPCTGMQEMFLYGSEAWPGAHVTQWIFSLDESVDILALGKAIDRCIIRYPTMRTRIVRNVQTGQLVQVVLRKGNEAPWSVFLSKDADSAMEQERQCHWMQSGLGEPLQRISLVQNSSGPTHLIWSLNHAAYDAWSLGMMLRSIGQYYAKPEDDSETSLPFSGFIRHIAKARNTGSESRSFWQTYLSDMGPQTLLFNYSSLKDPRQDCLAVYRVSFPKREGKTPTSLIAAAWILLLARLTHRIDITIAYLVTGRTLPLGGIDTCPGPLISKLPLRVRLPTESTGICDAADVVRTEMVRVMPHEHTGLDAMQSLTSQDAEATPLHAASLLGHLPFDLAIHPAGHTDFSGAKATGMAHVGQRVVVPPPGTFSAECSIVSENDNIEVDISMIWDDRAVDKKGVDDIIGTWGEIITEDT
ncbi:uncharacterized protein B0J16DRAFT_375847 [Fusarium flagelliforme]|uniref:uncharacterized protein n=1 Tax=Fusarium flagelliforme TaxID=2675880 RepID=UPI001E8E2EE0|nr:uncharacterized protein B0J16DRAFT_375847 [Fusarium flagelliforme]KAH7173129.1 hypothetical protein B0J16DRAFT_375847 [Fusarium flagelliforme]